MITQKLPTVFQGVLGFWEQYVMFLPDITSFSSCCCASQGIFRSYIRLSSQGCLGLQSPGAQVRRARASQARKCAATAQRLITPPQGLPWLPLRPHFPLRPPRPPPRTSRPRLRLRLPLCPRFPLRPIRWRPRPLLWRVSRIPSCSR